MRSHRRRSRSAARLNAPQLRLEVHGHSFHPALACRRCPSSRPSRRQRSARESNPLALCGNHAATRSRRALASCLHRSVRHHLGTVPVAERPMVARHRRSGLCVLRRRGHLVVPAHRRRRLRWTLHRRTGPGLGSARCVRIAGSPSDGPRLRRQHWSRHGHVRS